MDVRADRRDPTGEREIVLSCGEGVGRLSILPPCAVIDQAFTHHKIENEARSRSPTMIVVGRDRDHALESGSLALAVCRPRGVNAVKRRLNEPIGSVVA